MSMNVGAVPTPRQPVTDRPETTRALTSPRPRPGHRQSIQRALATATAAVLVTGALSLVLSGPADAASGPDTQLVSVAANGGPANGWADRPVMSGDGRYITFDSDATNLVPGVTTSQRRIYRRDLVNGQTDLVTVQVSGVPASGWSSYAWPSADGNLVAFTSDDGNLTPSGTVRRSVFVRDMTTGTTSLVSQNSAGVPANAASTRPTMSRDGRFIAFSSTASNLTAAGGNRQSQVYLRDTVAGTTQLISVNNSGALANALSYRGFVSSDGRYVVFDSRATNLVPGTSTSVERIYLRDTVAGTTTLVSARSDGTPATGSRPYMTPDAQYVLFNTTDALLPSDQGGHMDVYVWNRLTGSLTRPSVGLNGADGTGDSLRGIASDDARYVAFNSFSTNLVTSDKNGHGDVFVRDQQNGVTYLVSRSWSGGGANGRSFRPVPSADGSEITYLSNARNLVSGDSSQDMQVYAVSLASVEAAAPDTAPPSVQVAQPPNGATVTSPTTLSGTASDDVGVDRVYVSVRNSATLQWLQPDGSWAGTAARLSATLDNPGTPMVTWSREVTLPTGDYGFSTTAYDTSGNQAAVRPWRKFDVAGS